MVLALDNRAVRRPSHRVVESGPSRQSSVRMITGPWSKVSCSITLTMDEISLKPQLREPLSQSSRARGQNLVKPAGVGRGMIGGGWTAGDDREGGRWEARDADGRPRAGRALRSGDPQAARLLIERYQGVVFGLCYRMLSHRQDAEDVAQEAFVRALRSIEGFDVTRPLRPWLLEIAANRCRTALAHRARRPPASSQPIEDRPDPRPGLADTDDLAGELERGLQRSAPNIAWSSRCTTSRISPTRRSPRPSRGRSAPSRPGSTAPRPACRGPEHPRRPLLKRVSP